ncbi:hypothetical protein [Roseiterribacter gracilis]|uniref:SUEL-type lectin domain-containing protein n=1 Tax=Roseiterribacter gracilis TaxID=2812848 RepID=A0A8S8X6J3_9PROT|nr:hypothetical protein TMPK1_10650 [Rhodospirillales bacterium TMPK1]
MLHRRIGLLLLPLALAGCVTDQTGTRNAGYYPPSPSSSSYGGGQSYSAPPNGRPVHISDATWRAPDGRQCNAKRAVERQCDGRESCRVEADNDLCGDPAIGVGKKLVIGYKCGDGRVEVTVNEHKSVSLSCPR